MGWGGTAAPPVVTRDGLGSLCLGSVLFSTRHVALGRVVQLKPGVHFCTFSEPRSSVGWDQDDNAQPAGAVGTKLKQGLVWHLPLFRPWLSHLYSGDNFHLRVDFL